jgi:ABC-type Zn uptake system ZnuABC Zn-binding protein ZnuA
LVDANKGKVVITFQDIINDPWSGYPEKVDRHIFLSPGQAIELLMLLPNKIEEAEKQAKDIKDKKRKELEAQLRELDD